MIRLVVLGLSLVVTGCYSPRLEQCKITCTDGCPPGWACAGDGFCHETVNEPACNEEDLPPPVDGGRPRVDASGKADASMMMPDATGGPDAGCTTMPLLTNGDFEASTGTGSAKTVPGWVMTASGLTNIGQLVLTATEMGPPAQSTQAGAFAVRLGAATTTDRRICQGPFTVPAGTTMLRLNGSVWVTTQESQPTRFDHLDFVLFKMDAVSVFLEQIATFDNRTPHVQWTAFSKNADGPDPGEADAGVGLPPPPYANTSVIFCAVGISDVNAETLLRFDTLQLEAVVCP